MLVTAVLAVAAAMLPSGAMLRVRAPARPNLLLREKFHLEVDLGEGAGKIEQSLEPLFSSSQLITVRYPLPIELSMQPSYGVMSVTKDGYGLLVGDVLRACSSFQMRLDNTAFGLLPVGTRPSKCLFLADGKTPEEVVQALTANTDDKTKEVVMVFERPLQT